MGPALRLPLCGLIAALPFTAAAWCEAPRKLEPIATDDFRTGLTRWRLEADETIDPALARDLIARLEPAAREGLVARLRDLAFGDGALKRHEAQVMRRVGRLLGMEP